MSAPQLFDRYYVEAYDGRGGGLIAENMEVKLSWEGNDTPVATPALDYAGFTPGSKHLKITLKEVTSFSPTIDWPAVKVANGFVALQITSLSGKVLRTQGHISGGVGIDSADNKNTETDVELTCQPRTFT